MSRTLPAERPRTETSGGPVGTAPRSGKISFSSRPTMSVISSCLSSSAVGRVATKRESFITVVRSVSARTSSSRCEM